MVIEDTAVLLADDHTEIDGVFRALHQALESNDGARVFTLLDFLWARLAVHIRAENLRLFPAILSAAKPHSTDDEAAPSYEEAMSIIPKLRGDHDFFMHELAGAIKRMRALTATRQARLQPELLTELRLTIQEVKARLESHNQLEEEQVYKWPHLLLSSSGQAQLFVDLRKEIENLPPRFGKNLPM